MSWAGNRCGIFAWLDEYPGLDASHHQELLEQLLLLVHTAAVFRQLSSEDVGREGYAKCWRIAEAPSDPCLWLQLADLLAGVIGYDINPGDDRAIGNPKWALWDKVSSRLRPRENVVFRRL